MKEVTAAELAKHNKRDDMWISVEGQVLNVTDFSKRHPGGASVLRKVAGTEATKQFLKFHPTSVLRMLEPAEVVGKLKDYKAEGAAPPADDEQSQQLERNRKAKPALSEMYNLLDFELVARHTLERVGWYYYSSGADDEITLRENHRAYQRIWFRPKVLVDVSNIDYSTTMLGVRTNSPFYITATALAKLGHSEGEVVLTRAAHKKGLIQMLSTLSSCSIDEVMDAAQPAQPVWMQVYVNADREVTRRYIQHGEKLGVKGFFVTVDAPQLGRREKDMRSKYDADLADVQGDDEAEREQGAARAISSFIDPALSWKDVPFLRSCTRQPLALKGVGRWEDAVKAAECGLDAVVLSNHGGRQLEFSRSAVEVLAEVMPQLKKRGLDKKISVFVDGGIRRGTDVLKALCLGAKGVGIGRPFLYSMSTYGEAGVARAVQLLNDEIEMGMRLLGVTKIEELDESLLDTSFLRAHSAVPADHTSEGVYERLMQPQFRSKI